MGRCDGGKFGKCLLICSRGGGGEELEELKPDGEE